jgi:hypothetical protein
MWLSARTSVPTSLLGNIPPQNSSLCIIVSDPFVRFSYVKIRQSLGFIFNITLKQQVQVTYIRNVRVVVMDVVLGRKSNFLRNPL